MRRLRKYILANAPLKLLALAISFVLWTTYTSEPFAEIGFQVPLEFTNMPPQLEISGDVPTLEHVRVRGRSALLLEALEGLEVEGVETNRALLAGVLAHRDFTGAAITTRWLEEEAIAA